MTQSNNNNILFYKYIYFSPSLTHINITLKHKIAGIDFINSMTCFKTIFHREKKKH